MKLIHVFTVFSTAKSFFDNQFKYLSEQGYEIVLVSSSSEEALEFAKRNGIRFIPVEIPRALSLVAILKAIKTLINIFKQEEVDAVFGHTPVGALCAMVAAKLCAVKNRIYYRHGVIYTTMKGIKFQIFRLEEKFVASLATTVINVSHSLSRLAIRDGLNSDKKQYVIGKGTCGGIDAINLFNPEVLDKAILENKRKMYYLNEVDIVFGFVGRICKDKGIPELIEGFELFQKSHPNINAKLVLIGPLDTRDVISEESIQQIKKNEGIILTGRIPKNELPYYYSLLDVFVFPSHREGFGMSVIEASALKKPILVSRAHGCEDSIVEHVTGEYIQLTAESICKGLENMLDKDTRDFLGKNGRKNVLECYDTHVMWPLIADLYKQILK